ncbi:MAG TPA: FHA domain-containing protein [Anaerolineaceae bacterium]
MSALRIFYRLLGIGWLVVGAGLLLSLTIYVVLWLIGDVALPYLDPVTQSLLSPVTSSIAPGLQVAAGLVFGLFAIVLGFGLVLLKGWGRTIAIGALITLGLCFLALSITMWVRLSEMAPTYKIRPYMPVIIGLISIFCSIFIICIGIQLSTTRAMEAFGSPLPALPLPVQVRCPTCGGVLDLRNGRCDLCDTRLEQAPTPGMARLRDQDMGYDYPVSTTRLTRIGRDSLDLEIRLDDSKVSREHAFIEYHNGRFYLHDQGSTNGTFVNDLQQRDIEIKNEDLISFGGLNHFRFLVD